MNKETLPPPPDFDSPEEAKDIIHFLWNKLAYKWLCEIVEHHMLKVNYQVPAFLA